MNANTCYQLPLVHGSLFSGIGGFDLAAEWAGWQNAFHCEWNEFGQKILKYYWPNAKSYGDITQTDFTIWRNRIDVLSGGFPCQPYSHVGKRLGKEDDRHLWPQMLRTIREVAPSYVVGENVHGIVTWNRGMVFHEVQVELENEGYEVQPCLLPACAVGALHRRDRTWFVAYSKHNRIRRWEQQQKGKQETFGTIANTTTERLQESRNQFRQEYELFINPPTDFTGGITTQWSKAKRGSGNVSKNDGIPEAMDGITVSQWKQQSIKAFGNAIVPQVAFEIFKCINSHERSHGCYNGSHMRRVGLRSTKLSINTKI
jgi:DNA (cytosine-5)-methyltransferase 1